MLKFCNVSDIAQYGPKSEIFVDVIYLNLYLYLSIKLPRPPPTPCFGVFMNKMLTHNFFLENEPLMRETNFTLGPI